MHASQGMVIDLPQNIQSNLYVRISAHVYNERDEYERLARAILVWARNDDASIAAIASASQ